MRPASRRNRSSLPSPPRRAPSFVWGFTAAAVQPLPALVQALAPWLEAVPIEGAGALVLFPAAAAPPELPDVDQPEFRTTHRMAAALAVLLAELVPESLCGSAVWTITAAVRAALQAVHGVRPYETRCAGRSLVIFPATDVVRPLCSRSFAWFG